MARPASSDDDKKLALALRSLQLSSNDFDSQIAQLPSKKSTSISHPCTPTNKKDYLVLVLRLLRLPSDDFDERLHHMISASASKEAHLPIPPNESDEDNVKLALNYQPISLMNK
jgi:hypothetical protein